MTRVFESPWLLWGSRLLLGAVFLYAAWPKVMDQATFAAAIHNYKMVPASLIPLFATTLAGFELVVAIALIGGVWRKGAGVAVTGMLVMFIVALTIAYFQGRSIDCGCFLSELSEQRAADIRGHMVRRILEDLGMLVLAVNLTSQAFRGR